MTKLYLAYGSNLNVRGMRRRCPSAEKVGVRMLQNARLVFRGVADLAYAQGYVTPAGLWRINDRDEEALDSYEGVASRFYRKVTIKLGKEKRREALIYLMTDRVGIYPPSQYYVDTIREGYRDFNLDEKILDEAIRHSFEKKNPSQQTVDRRRRQINSTHQRQLVCFPQDAEDVEETEDVAGEQKLVSGL